ncbi:MAG TPA: hypothetical protein VKG38_08420, partial [Solirubrobacteraceae bacterium]|nr:hypothetical protein [Solirubrobacteraceae bacterium]
MSTVTQRAGVVIGEGTLASDAGLAPRIGQRRVLGAALVCLFAMTVAVLASASKPGTDRVVLRRNPQTHPATLVPASLGPVASSAIGASNHSFWPVRHGASLVAQGGGIRGTFTASGADLRVAEGTLGLSFVGVGRGGLAERIPTALPTAVGSTLTYRHGSVAEFYRTGPYGLEQGFNVLQRPRSSGPIELALAVSGSLAPEQTGQSILFRTPSGVTALKYDQLSAVDATGRLLPARMELSGRLLRLQVDDGGAHYPITIDPFIQQGSKVTGNGEIGGSNFGRSVALSSNGNIALIGGGSDNGKQGAAWVFTRSGSTWTQQAELTGSGESGEAEFGESVALSSEGNTALIGGMYDNGHIGAAWVFTRSGSTWTQQGAKLTGTGETGKGDFGASVALSSEGNTALIGGSADTSSAGAAWVFMRTGTTWSQQGSKLTGSGATGKANFGTSAALSSEGNTALIGGQGDNSKTGAVWVFTRTGTTWSQQGSKLTGSGEEGPTSAFGYSVALSSEGNTALIGGYADDYAIGAAWQFTRSGSTWSQQGAKLVPSEESGASEFGYSTALSANGTTAVIGGPADNSGVGAAWAFVLPPTVVSEPASSITQTAATLNATVNPNGQSVTSCVFEYGPTSSYGSTQPCSSLPGSGTSPVAVSATLTTLNPSASYHYRIAATNAGGTSYGGDQSFTTLSSPPAVVSEPATGVMHTTATLNATVNPNNQTVSSCQFEYGETLPYEFSVPCSSLPGSGASPVSVSASLTGLDTRALYHYRIVATNPTGTSDGSDQTFATALGPAAPAVTTEAASSLTQTSATLNASVNP